MYDCESYEEFTNIIQNMLNSATESDDTDNIVYKFYQELQEGELSEETEEEFIDIMLEGGKKILSYRDVDKLEELGIKVITVQTPYGTELYTSSFGDEVSCTFCKNGEYEFTIISGGTAKKEKVKISNIRNYDIQAPHEVYVEIDNQGILEHTIDDSEEKSTLTNGIIQCNNKITADTKLKYRTVKMNEEFYKYFNSFEEWLTVKDAFYLHPGKLVYTTVGYGLQKSRQFYIYTIFLGETDDELSWEYFDLANELVEEAYEQENPTYSALRYALGEYMSYIPEDVLQKYPQIKMACESTNRITEITGDTHLGIVATHCITTDMYVEVVAWDEEKKKWMRRRKKIKDVTYNDKLLVWDFDKGEFTTAKPLWIMKPKVATSYNLLKFSDGSILKTINQHRIFNKEKGKFTYPMTEETPIGTTTYTADGKEVQLISKEVVITKEIEYINIITEYHMNIFANNILTSCRFSNLYPIEDMKYVKDERNIISKEEYPNIPEEYYYGLRLGEQPKEVNRGNDVKHDNNIEEYIKRIISNGKEKI